jgi:hypothetical protein
MIQWVGSINLEVQFTVTDADTGIPIENARINVVSYGGLHDERDMQRFTLKVDREGVAKRSCQNLTCDGTRSGLRLTDTHHVYLPWWRFQATAPGYETVEWTDLGNPEFGNQVRVVGPHAPRLVIPIELRPVRPQN